MKIVLLSIFVFSCFVAVSQIGVNTENPHPSAELHIHSTKKGVLLPTLTDDEMDNISSPTTGLIIFNTTNKAYYYYNGLMWAMIGTAGKTIADADNDTKVQIEKTADDDIMRIDIGSNSGATTEDMVTLSKDETVVKGDYTIPTGESLETDDLLYPNTAGQNGTVLSTDGDGELSWQEPHGGLGLSGGIQTMYFAEANNMSAFNSKTYFIPVIPFSSMTIDTLEVFIGSISGNPSIKCAVYDRSGNRLAVSDDEKPSGSGLFEVGLKSVITLESAKLYYFAVTDLNNTSTTLLSNNFAQNPYNRLSSTSTLSSSTIGSTARSIESIWIVAH